MNNFLWRPDNQRVQNSILSDFIRYVNLDSKNDFKKIWEWSISNPEIFWSKFWDYSKIIGDKGKEIIRKDKTFNKTKFFPDSKINYSENILKKKMMKLQLIFYPKQVLKKILHGACYTKKSVNSLHT